MHMGSVRRVLPPRVLRTLPLLFVAGLLASCGSSGSTTAGTSPVALDGGGSGSGQASAVGDGASSRLSADGRSQLCYRIEVTGVTGVDGTSLHEGDAGARGAVVLGLDPPAGGSVEGCVTADSALLEHVGRSPQEYYVNVRSEDHPDGALRGQLAAQGA
jgi:hypothetical protein